MSKHRVRRHVWKEGRLHIIDDWFNNFEEALLHSKNNESHSYKIFDENNVVIASNSIPTNIYA